MVSILLPHNMKAAQITDRVHFFPTRHPGKEGDREELSVVNGMHGYGMDLTAAESDAITDLLDTLRAGMEKEAG